MDPNFYLSDDSNNIKKSKFRNSFGFSDEDTGDIQVDSILNAKHINENNYCDDFIYEGQMLNGRRNGKGLIKTNDGKLLYEGLFKNDLYNGEGTLILENGFVYSGNFLNGKRSGRGLLFSNYNLGNSNSNRTSNSINNNSSNNFNNDEKYRYEGEWQDDCKSGNGTETYPDGSSYIGEFFNNKKNGRGIYYMNDGSIYDGEFKDDKLEGFGKFTWAEDKIYEGQWKNNSIDGFGVFIKHEKIYIGNFCFDKKHGLGMYLLKNGNTLVGNFESGDIEGLSIIVPKIGPQQLCFMNGSKVKILITDENEKNNIKIGMEYKTLKVFYEENKSVIKKFET